jgi:hypothetical protein
MPHASIENGGFQETVRKRLVTRDLPSNGVKTQLRSHWAQYRAYRARYRRDVLLFQVGCFFEFYAAADTEIAQMIGLRPIGPNPRSARFGIPARHAPAILGVPSFLVQ